MTSRVLVLAGLLSLATTIPTYDFPSRLPPVTAPAVVIPFDLVNRHIVMKVTVKGRPLAFVLDTGARAAIIEIDRARELGLTLEGAVSSGGAGAGRVSGSSVRNATYSVSGLPRSSEPLAFALPMTGLAPGLGQDVDGIFGGAFIEKFVVDVDYEARRLTLHDRDEFSYSGPGKSVPMQLDANGHPTIRCVVKTGGGASIYGSYLLDLGSGGSLILYSPVVRDNNLPEPTQRTYAASGTGAGGETTGRTGRVASIQCGPYQLMRPLTMFSTDAAGAMASPLLSGNIGMQIASRFRVFLDYRHDRIIFEPTSHLNDPFERAFSGIIVRTQPPDHHSFVALQVLPDSPALAAGMQKGDVITAIDGKPASSLTLTQVIELLERPGTYALTVKRGEQILAMSVTPIAIQ